jgi:hypothetical protein
MKNANIFFAMIFALGMITGCTIVIGDAPTPAGAKPVVSIGSPAQGAQVALGQEVLVQASATDLTGIVRIELWVDGMLTAVAQPSLVQPAYAAVLRWTAAIPGAHTLAVKGINTSSAASDPAVVVITVIGAPTSALTATAPPPNTAAPPTAASPTNTLVTPTACTNDSALVEHVTVPDGTNWAAGQAFNKIWRVRNTGTCTWGAGYEFVFVGGTAMTTKQTLSGPSVAPGDTVDLLIAMTAPTTPGAYSGQWRMRNQSGLFGATMQVAINVIASAPPPAACPGPPVIGEFKADPASIFSGSKTTLSWGLVSNATSATIDQGIGGVATPGSVEVKPDKTTTFTLTATGCGGTVTKQVTVNVTPTMIVVPLKRDLGVTDLYADPSWKVYIKIRNNGALAVTNFAFSLSCTVGKTPPVGLPSASGQSGPITVSLNSGQESPFYTGVTLDTVAYYDVSCNITPPNDDDSSNNAIAKKFTRGP